MVKLRVSIFNFSIRCFEEERVIDYPFKFIPYSNGKYDRFDYWPFVRWYLKTDKILDNQKCNINIPDFYVFDNKEGNYYLEFKMFGQTTSYSQIEWMCNNINKKIKIMFIKILF